ncbi:MAG: DUF2059 domain-containing protein [Pseudomonadota bacterium]|nr:DUF2059 domain-containing protein [Pseudomonadota bacterium]
MAHAAIAASASATGASATNPASADQAPERAARLRALIQFLGVQDKVVGEVEDARSGARRQAERMSLEIMKDIAPPAETRGRIEAAVSAYVDDYARRTDPDRLLGRLAERLGQTLSDTDLERALAFYQSPLYARLREALAAADTAQQQWLFDVFNDGVPERRRALHRELRALRETCQCPAPVSAAAAPESHAGASTGQPH